MMREAKQITFNINIPLQLMKDTGGILCKIRDQG